MRLLSREESRKLDAYIAEDIGIPIDILAERAGIALAKACLSRIRDKQIKRPEVIVFAGKGMNGADALVCARELYSIGLNVSVYADFADKQGNKERWQLKACRNLGMSFYNIAEFSGCDPDVIVDGLFGTAFDVAREEDADFENVVGKIGHSRERGAYVIAADIPSGVDCNNGSINKTAVKADETITFFAPKPGLYTYPGKAYAGKVTVDRSGLPAETIATFMDSCISSETNIFALTISEVSEILPKRKADGHKGTFGKVAVIGGSEGMAGAVCLCGEACYRSGAGLIYLIVPEDIRYHCLRNVPEALTSADLKSLSVKPDVVIAGPGGETSRHFEDLMYEAISSAPEIVLDARALRVIAKDPKKAKQQLRIRLSNGLSPAVITPHPGEMKALMPEWEDDNRISAACEAANEYSCVCVLKGAGTVIADPDMNVMINTTGNSSMAKGGSGDILSGIIGAMMAQGLKSLQAAAVGVFLHGLCGDIAAGEKGEYCADPSDILDKLPDGFRKILKGS